MFANRLCATGVSSSLIYVCTFGLRQWAGEASRGTEGPYVLLFQFDPDEVNRSGADILNCVFGRRSPEGDTGWNLNPFTLTFFAGDDDAGIADRVHHRIRVAV